MQYLVENPWPVAIVLTVSAGWFGFRWSQTRRRRDGLIALGLLGGVAVVFALELLVTTDREEVEAALRDLAAAVVDGDSEAALAFLEADEQLRNVIRQGMRRVDVHEGLRIKDIRIQVNGETADCHFRANGAVDVDTVKNRHAVTRWNVRWQRKDAGWRITNVERLDPLSGEPIGTFSTGR